jgi:predicted permease
MIASLSEVRHVLGAIWRRKALFIAVVVPLALALAVNSALFSVVDGLLLRPLPFQNPQDLVALEYRKVNGQLPALAFDPSRTPDREAIRARIEASGLIARAAVVRPGTAFGARAKELGVEVTAVDWGFFELLGNSSLVGRTFTSDDGTSPAVSSPTSSEPLPVVIGHSLWIREFGGDAGVLGVHSLAGRRVRIVGVMHPGFKFPGETNVWTPMRQSRQLVPTHVRLAAGATVEQLASMAPDLVVTSLAAAMRPNSSQDLLVLLGAAALLLFVAWVQVGSLVLAGAAGRVHDIGVRFTLGARRRDVLVGFAMENFVLAGSALALAWVATRPLTIALLTVLPASSVRGQYLMPEQRTLLFACGSTFIGFVLLTALPNIIIRKTSPMRLLHGQVGDLRLNTERFRRALLTVQVGLTATLLYLSGLMVHSYAKAATFDYGFDSRRVLLFEPPFPKAAAATDLNSPVGLDADFEARSREQVRRRVEAVEALERTPGVTAAAHFFLMPLIESGNLNGWEEAISFDRREVTPRVRVHVNAVSRGFVSALGAKLVAGSSFDDPQLDGVVDIALVNETFAKQFAPSFSAMGSDIQVSVVGRQLATTWFKGRVVGVIRDLVYAKPTESASPQVFVLDAKGGSGRLFAIRTSSSLEAVLPAVRTTVGRIWEEVPDNRFSLLRDVWRTNLRPYSSPAELLTFITALSLPLATVGLVGFLMYSVRLRSREIAIRVALGASPRTVGRSVVRSALLVVGIGLLAGISLGVAAGRMIGHQLFMVHPLDGWTVLGASMMLLTIGWLAALLPARKASQTEPMAALRQV